jgi:hypothetical protein
MDGDDDRIRVSGDRHEGDGAEDQRPSGIPVEPVHLNLTPWHGVNAPDRYWFIFLVSRGQQRRANPWRAHLRPSPASSGAHIVRGSGFGRWQIFVTPNQCLWRRVGETIAQLKD